MATTLHSPTDGPLSARIAGLSAGSTLRLAPGAYRGPLVLERDVTIEAQALGTVTIEPPRGCAVLWQEAPSITLRKLVLKGPALGLGAVIRGYDAAEVVLEECVIIGGRGEGEGGGGLDLQAGRVVLKRCRLLDNMALQGGAVRVAGPALVEASACVFAGNRAEGQGGGAVFTNRGGVAQLSNCTFERNVGDHGSALLAGRGAGGGRIEAVHCLFAQGQEGLAVAVHAPGTVSLQHSAIGKLAAQVSDGVAIGAGVVEKSVPLALEPPPYRPMFATQLDGVGARERLLEGSVDLYGRPWGSTLVGAVG